MRGPHLYRLMTAKPLPRDELPPDLEAAAAAPLVRQDARARSASPPTAQAWWLVPVLLFLPDLCLAGYARSHVSALTYDFGHSYLRPALVAGALALDETAAVAVALVWFAHIGLDRMLGYGLKHDDAFTRTHLGVIGRTGAVRPGDDSAPCRRSKLP